MSFVRRMGGAVRNAISGGITFAARLRRPATPPSGRNPVPAAAQAAPAPKRPRAQRRPRSTPVAAPARPGWFARWFGPGRSRRAPFLRARRPDNDAPFTPKAYPNLPPEFCAILNTPVEECDPVLVRLLFAALAQHLAASMPPEADMTEAQKAMAKLWGELIAKFAEAGPDVPPAEAAAAAAPDAPPVSPASLAAEQPAPANGPAATAIAGLPAPVLPRYPGSQSFRNRRSRVLRCPGARLRRGVRDARHRPPARRHCYAACAGPP